MLSVYDGDRITAEASWQHFANSLGYSSAGVIAATVDECAAGGASAIPDPTAFPEHVLIDFGGLSNARVKAVGKTLTQLARKRGWQYRPSEASQ